MIDQREAQFLAALDRVSEAAWRAGVAVEAFALPLLRLRLLDLLRRRGAQLRARELPDG
jgi:hypothetical protein